MLVCLLVLSICLFPWPVRAAPALSGGAPLAASAAVASPPPATRPAAGPAHMPAEPADPWRAAITQFKVDRWQTGQGLPMDTVQSLLQARDGSLWVGTGAGLARFDGSRFSTFEASPVAEMAARPIFGLMEDRQGHVWIGHIRGAARYHQGRFEPVVDARVTEGRRVWAFAQAADGSMWMASENGLLHWRDGQTRVFREADGLPTRRLRSLAFDTQGRLWIATSGGGLVRMDGERFTVHRPDNGFPHLEVRQVLADPAGGVWAATAGAGLVHLHDGQQRRWTMADGLPTDQLTTLARDQTGVLWIGTWGGGVVRLRDGQLTVLKGLAGLEGDHVWSLHADREGSVWVGTWHDGLNRLGRRAFAVLGKPEGLSHDSVRAVLHARDGATWVAMAGGGINRIAGGHITRYGTREGLPTDQASALLEDTDGALWAGTYTHGLVRLHQGRVQVYGTAQGLPHADVRLLLRDRAGTLWVGTVAGLARFDGRGFVPVREPGAPTDGVVSALQDREGTLWFGTAGSGLVRYRDGVFDRLTRQHGLSSNWILALHEDTNGSLWIGTSGEGINRLRHGRVSVISVTDGLWDGLAQVILEDRAGQFWVSGNRGFYRVARAELDALADGRQARVASTGYGPGDALRATTFAGGVQPAGAVDTQGHVWLPSIKGLVIVDPARLPDAGAPPPVSIDEVVVGGQSVASGAAVVVPPGAVPLRVLYTAGTLLNAERVRFRYRMDGLSPDWVNAGHHREATFAALPHGSYRFQVAVSLDGRRWQEAAAPLAITVQPQVWHTAWFRVAAGLLVVALLAGAYRLRTHALRRRHAEMQRLVAEKTEELRQANEVLQRLSYADALTGLANRRRLDEVLDTEWRRALRQQTPLAVVIADIDAFKAYNDTLGHPVGDRCLVDVADVIRTMANRAGDFAARYGGEEFILLIPGADATAAQAFAERLRQACEARALPHPASPVAGVVTLSLGVAAVVPTQDSQPEALVAQADAALYRAKQEGRNRVR